MSCKVRTCSLDNLQTALAGLFSWIPLLVNFCTCNSYQCIILSGANTRLDTEENESLALQTGRYQRKTWWPKLLDSCFQKTTHLKLEDRTFPFCSQSHISSTFQSCRAKKVGLITGGKIFYYKILSMLNKHSVSKAFQKLHMTALHWRFMGNFHSNKLERFFFSPLQMEACILAVIPRHLFVLVCDESLKRVPCPNWESLPFTHLYEPNDPNPQGRLFIGFLFSFSFFFF